MTHTLMKASLCTGGKAIHITLSQPVIHVPDDVQMEEPALPLKIQVSTHHIKEHL
jgi:hypothetical protein